MAASEVPQGTVQDVLDWVGDDPDRARQALDAEQSGQQRTTLTSKLEDIADQQEDAVTSPTSPDNPNQPDQPDQPNQPTGTDNPGTGSSGSSDIAGTSGNPASPDAPSRTGSSGSGSSGSGGSTGTSGGDIPGPGGAAGQTASGTPASAGAATETGDPDTPGAGETDLDEDEQIVPEQPTEVAINPNDTGTLISPVHARDYDVEVPDDADMIPVVEPVDDEEDEADTLEAEQVEFFQIASSTNGVIIAINGTPYGLQTQMAASLKTNLDKAVAGLAL